MEKVLESLTADKDPNQASPMTTTSTSTGVSSLSPPASTALPTAAISAHLNAHRLMPFVSPAARLEMNLQHLQQQQQAAAMFPFQQFRGLRLAF